MHENIQTIFQFEKKEVSSVNRVSFNFASDKMSIVEKLLYVR